MPDSPVRGDRAPVFHLPSTSGDVSLEELLAGGKRLVLAFYFEDATPSCESEISMLRDAWDIFVDQGTNVLAVSADDVESHRKFAQRLAASPSRWRPIRRWRSRGRMA